METLEDIEKKIKEIDSDLYDIKAGRVDSEGYIIIKATTCVMVLASELRRLNKEGFILAYIVPGTNEVRLTFISKKMYKMLM